MILLEFKKPLLLDRYSNSDARNLNFLQSYSETYRYQFPFKQEIWKLLPLKNASNFHTRMQQRNEKKLFKIVCKLFKAIWSSTHYNILALSRYMQLWSNFSRRYLFQVVVIIENGQWRLLHTNIFFLLSFSNAFWPFCC